MLSLEDLSKREQAAADELGTAASAIGRGAISSTLATVARAAVLAVQGDQGRGELGEPAADLRELRTNPMLRIAMDRDLVLAERNAFLAITSALEEGYMYDAMKRSEVIADQSKGLEFDVDITDQELRDLADYPIHGHTPREIARRMRLTLNDAIDEALARPLTGTIDPAQVPVALAEVARIHGDKLATAVREAYFAGVQAATNAIGKALVGS